MELHVTQLIERSDDVVPVTDARSTRREDDIVFIGETVDSRLDALILVGYSPFVRRIVPHDWTSPESMSESRSDVRSS